MFLFSEMFINKNNYLTEIQGHSLLTRLKRMIYSIDRN